MRSGGTRLVRCIRVASVARIASRRENHGKGVVIITSEFAPKGRDVSSSRDFSAAVDDVDGVDAVEVGTGTYARGCCIVVVLRLPYDDNLRLVLRVLPKTTQPTAMAAF
jgi:hypothetical protein